ncbi:hypothetical protein ACOYR1_14705 [Thalassotalea piscium]
MTKSTLLFVIFSLALLPLFTYADGLSDLKNALKSLQKTSTLSAKLLTTSYFQQGEGKDKIIRDGSAEISLIDDEKGLQVTYSNDILTKLEIEASERIKDENAKTPTLNAIGKNNATEIKSIVSAGSEVLRTITQASFVNEETVNLDGKVLRQLNFKLPVSAIINDKRTRKYVKKFTSQYSVVIDGQGIPIKTTLNFSGKGRAYWVLSVKAEGFEHSTYQLINQRLVRVTNESGAIFDSTFGYSERKHHELLTITEAQEPDLFANTQ